MNSCTTRSRDSCGLLQAVKDAGVSDDQLLDTALKAVDKLADAFEVRDGNIDDCF